MFVAGWREGAVRQPLRSKPFVILYREEFIVSRRIHQTILRGGGGATLLLGLAVFCSAALAQNISITPGTVHQTVRGFGGMNAPGWINDLTTAQVEKAYGSGEGQLGLSIMRMRIDPNSAAWNIQVPAAKRAKELGATLFATPWSPPAHMKSNKSLINGGKLLPEYYSAYTTHLLDFANFMSRNNAPLYAISIQNEPDWLPDYESCEWSGTDFVNYLSSQGSRFGELKVIAPESLGFNTRYSDPILNSATAEPHVDIIGGHLYGVLPKDYPLARQKGKEIWMTEHYTESKNSGDAWPLALDVGTELHQSMVANYNAYVWWYVRRSYGLLLENGNVSKRGYIMSQYARFVRPGSKRIGATEKPYADVLSTAYLRPDNKIVLVVVNQGTAQRQLNVSLPGRTGSFVKYSTSGTLNVGYGGRYSLSNGATSFWVEPQSVATFLLEDVASSSSSSSSRASSASSAASSAASSVAASSASSSAAAATTSGSAGCGATARFADGKYSVTVDGVKRDFWVDVPAGYSPTKRYPLIVGLHWRGGQATDVHAGASWASQKPYFGLKELYGESAIFVAPNGLDSGWANSGGRDIRFVQAMVNQLKQGLCVDNTRVHATGFSFGGMMSNAIGCQMGDTFRAVAPMSGSLWSGCAESNNKVAAILIHSRADNVVPYSAGEEARNKYLSKNSCGKTTVKIGSNGCVEYQGCGSSTPVAWCGYDGGGHWPPAFAAQEIKKFFDRF